LNILYLINHAGQGGTETYVKTLAKSFKEKGDNIFFVYNEKCDDKKSGLLSDMLKLNITSHQISMSSPFDISAAKKLADFAKAHKIGVIHTQFGRENYIAVLSKLFYKTPKIIYTAHIHIHNNAMWRAFNKRIIKHNKNVIAVCTSIFDQLIRNNYPKHKIHIIFNGVKRQKNHKKSISEAKIITFVTLSRLSEEKGMQFLLDAAKNLRKAHSNFELLIAGGGCPSLKKELESFIQQNNLSEHVKLLGHITNVEEILDKSHVYINSSSSEALSLGILEAMSFGLPVIATNVGGNADIINNKTNCGILVEYGDAKKLAQTMSSFIDKTAPYEQFSQNAIVAIENTFNIENTINKTYDLYN